ncbi:MAG: hypothetical protein F6K19_09635 [Cyanothece sp. SIO1E1]|nr:hypothetical protein [Cyanothece sp. SIO1E1]
MKDTDTPETPKVETNFDQAGNLNNMAPSESTEQWHQSFDKVSELLSNFPEFIGDFWGKYQRPILVVAAIFSSLVVVKLTLAILGALNDIPLLAPTFELIGIVYTGWFVYRYLLRASNRQDLGDAVSSLKEQVFGQGSQKS